MEQETEDAFSALERQVMKEIFAEVARTRKARPLWPTNPIIGAAMVCAESEGLIAAAIGLRESVSIGTVRQCDIEAIQTAAACVRFVLRG